MKPKLFYFKTEERRHKSSQKSFLSSFKAIGLYSIVLAFLVISCNNSREYVPKAKQLVPSKSDGFKTGEVRLLDGPFKVSQDAETKYLLSLDLDRLIAPFRKESGLETKANPYPGKETTSLPGVALSFYLSGVSRLYALTGEEKYLSNLNYLLDKIEECQSKNNGYLLGTRGGKAVFEKLEKEGYYSGFNDWSIGQGEPYYVMEKLFSGLIDAYRICNSPKAYKIATNLADWLSRHMSKINDVELKKIMKVEYGGMNWVLSDMYVISGDKKYLEMSKRWQDEEVVVPMTKGIDVLTGIHANTQFPKMSGLAARYPFTGNPEDLNGAKFFWESVVNHRTYVTGGNSDIERFSPKDSLSNTLTPYNEENCNEYNMLKLTALLNKIEPRIEYADYMERTLYNHILSSQNPSDGKISYFLPLIPGAERVYMNLYDNFCCCVCSGLDCYMRHGEYIYAHNGSDILVNLFIASQLNWKEKGITLTQETRFPYEASTSFKLTCNQESEFSLLVRNPYWAAKQVTIKVNGEVQQLGSSLGYFTITRKWRSGDLVEVALPMNIRTESMPDEKNKIALFYGPILLAGALEKETADHLTYHNFAPALVPGDKTIDQWLVPSGEPLKFVTTVARPKEVRLEPLFTLKAGPYAVYWQKMTEKDWLQSLSNVAMKGKDLDNITIDKVIVGNEESEKKHALTGKSYMGKGNAGILTDMAWRVASSSEGLSYKMKVPSSSAVSLACKFMGGVTVESWNCKVKIDTTMIAQSKTGRSYPATPFDSIFPIPPELTKNRDSVKVVFDGRMPRLMEMRIIRR
ncbi:MAG: glycoside hydrolase family 127 protein [Prolixibacteraceae bacterium]|nr:glycoside hydrolase family 127 protein [Prolixibacteraceae bacterium]